MKIGFGLIAKLCKTDKMPNRNISEFEDNADE